MSLNKYHIIIIVESVLLAAALGLGIWWYVYNEVQRNVEKTFETPVYKVIRKAIELFLHL